MRRLFALPVALVLVFSLAVPAFAGGRSAVFHGVLDGAQFRCGEAVVPLERTVSGDWTVNVTGNYGVVTINAWYDGAHHTSFGMSQGVASRAADGVHVDYFGGFTEGGYSAIVGVDGSFEWQVALPYVCPAESPYDNLSYLGFARE